MAENAAKEARERVADALEIIPDRRDRKTHDARCTDDLDAFLFCRYPSNGIRLLSLRLLRLARE